jgi:hypothetical protein
MMGEKKDDPMNSPTTSEFPAFRDDFPTEEVTCPELRACPDCGQTYTMHDAQFGHVCGEFVPHPRRSRGPSQ